MNKTFVGWDVGAWHCSNKSKSKDALCVLQGSSLSSLVVSQVPWRGNLKNLLLQKASIEDVFSACFKEALGRGVLAIDTPLGWPAAFRRLLDGEVPGDKIISEARSNPMLLRADERALCEEGFKPLSSLTDRIGSQSTKGLYLLGRYNFRTQSRGVWNNGRWKAIETYPSVVATSKTARFHFRRLKRQTLFLEKASKGNHVRADVSDALWCALQAAMFEFRVLQVIRPTTRDPLVRAEGWIWRSGDVSSSRTRLART